MRNKGIQLSLSPLTVPADPSDAQFSTFISSLQGGTYKAGRGAVSVHDLESLSILGRGNSGVVRKVRHRRSGDFYALKLIQLSGPHEQSARTQIMRELDILLTVDSPLVVRCFNASCSDGVISIVLEYMDGGTLADLIKSNGRISEPYIAAIAKQVLQGLVYLNKERHVIHRDIKPSNLLVNTDGDVKIADFGVSAVLANSVAMCDSFVGTQTYMSPERIMGERYGYKCDVWSVGLSLMECAIGRFPYPPPPGESGWNNFFDLLQTVAREPPPSLPASDPSFSPEFRSFINCCLRKNPRQRASSPELLNHPFIRKYEGRSIDIADLIH
ncbi:hypothetical protein CBR_g38176 [Chara braunii]|uniref:mitogen-activated protein kinase kinase n=1 Tax=Chara braunii TaxID=69332 RepID=A0A388LPH7_CHABU|nr:hypothetical protein CBR_g38176 [Chara braunii]|eukprot:GBG84204.1 hypothetical protein CBR_g38176 [Chara braunii]